MFFCFYFLSLSSWHVCTQQKVVVDNGDCWKKDLYFIWLFFNMKILSWFSTKSGVDFFLLVVTEVWWLCVGVCVRARVRLYKRTVLISNLCVCVFYKYLCVRSREKEHFREDSRLVCVWPVKPTFQPSSQKKKVNKALAFKNWSKVSCTFPLPSGYLYNYLSVRWAVRWAVSFPTDVLLPRTSSHLPHTGTAMDPNDFKCFS